MTMAERKYKAGDRHPDHEFLAFVRYDVAGKAEWTSDYFDPSAPFRLAARNTRGDPEYRPCGQNSTGK